MTLYPRLHPTVRPTRLLIAAVCALAIAGCASNKGEPATQFDFGPAAPASASASTAAAPNANPLGALVVTDVTGSSALDNERIYYRLSYADPLQARTYANSRWSASPLQLLTQRLKTRIGQAGAKVLSETDASSGIPILRIDVDDFVHDFSGATQSAGVVALRASVFKGHALVDQKTFVRRTDAVSADAAGGARALAGSTDAVAADIAAWLASLDLAHR
ncbi:ABC-type transport auxiliary lipoprotein family protein [Massilia sp. 9096]|uniref:ABC-type transport auxiliary lipoprotein family protein n=1 Tax=Massilia sp. 9096 TaxID=1500894 RepID=UPI000A8F422E|nr:ABC-type transport auxiliary lipoprotein family protein [Massilia sp. 9096]